MATRKSGAGMVAVTPGGTITEDMIAGYVTMFAVPDAPVGALKLLRTWSANDLDTEMLPPARRAVHVFQAACRSVADSARNGGNQRSEVVVDEIMETANECVYQITRRIRDRQEKLIDHPKAMRVTFSKSDESITCDPLDPAHYAPLAGLEDAIRESYDANSSKVPGYKVRGLLRSYMGLLGGTNMRGKAGGVYFIPARGKETLDALAEALEKLYGGKAELFTIPLANDEGAREMIRKHFTVNATTQIDELMAKIAEALHGSRERAIRSDFLGNVSRQRGEITSLKNEYSGLLRSELDELASKIADLDEQVEALSDAASAE